MSLCLINNVNCKNTKCTFVNIYKEIVYSSTFRFRQRFYGPTILRKSFFGAVPFSLRLPLPFLTFLYNPVTNRWSNKQRNREKRKKEKKKINNDTQTAPPKNFWISQVYYNRMLCHITLYITSWSFGLQILCTILCNFHVHL